MILKLFPQRPDHPLADAKEFKRILAELHVDKAAKAVDELVGWFESLQHAENFRLDHYFDVLRQLDDAGQQHLRNLVRDYLDSPQLSTLERQRLWELSFAYWNVVAGHYSACIERARIDPKGRGTGAFNASLALAEVRLQAARRSCLKWLAYRYESASRDFWKAFGRSFLAAEGAGHAQKMVQLYPGQAGSSSVAQQYLHALVFFASAMDGLLPQQIELADRVITHFVPSFICSSDCRPDSLYRVDAASGSPPARLASHPQATRSSLRYVSTGPALPALEELIHVVERDEVPVGVNLGGGYSQKALLQVLRHLRIYWALQPPKRRHQRHAVKAKMAVVHGFERSYALFSGMATQPEISTGTRNWVVENVSRGGFRVCFDASAGERIRIGALLCMQPEGGDNWLLGTARRLNKLDGRANLGIQVLSRQAQSVELRPRRSGFSAAVANPGIYLHDGGEPGVARIVLPLGGFNVRETLDCSLDGSAHRLTPVEVESSGVDYEIARFHDQLLG